MVDFRLIALCNVSYKIISKVLVRRLKEHLGSIVSEERAAFIIGQMITDNVIVAHELLHCLKVRKQCVISYMTIKMDITKAYDRLYWDFLRITMEKMRFARRWIGWIMQCITLVNFRFKSMALLEVSLNLNEEYAKVILYRLTFLFYVMKFLAKYSEMQNYLGNLKV